MSDIPDNALRGIRDKNHVNPDKRLVKFDAFVPKWNPKKEEARPDGCLDVSINLQDGPEAVNQLKQNESNCRFGIACFPTAAVAMLASPLRQIVRIERAIRDDNPYHGNVVYRDPEDRDSIKKVAHFLALSSDLLS